jgi:hypothetical protein
VADQQVKEPNMTQVYHGYIVRGADGATTLNVVETELPEFWGIRTKDSLPADDFIKRIDKMMKAFNWSEKLTFSYFAQALRGSANTWLESQVTLSNIKGDRETWSIIKPLFKAEFGVHIDDEDFLDEVANMAMRPNETVRAYFSRLHKIMEVINDAYKSYAIKPQMPAPDQDNLYKMEDVEKYIKDREESYSNFVLHILFRAGLPSELRRVPFSQLMKCDDVVS